MMAAHPTAALLPARAAPFPFLKAYETEPKLLDAVASIAPQDIRVFHEPMLWDGGVYLRLRPERAYLSTALLGTVRAFQGIRDDVEDTIHHVSTFPRLATFETFLAKRYPDLQAPPLHAAIAIWRSWLEWQPVASEPRARKRVPVIDSSSELFDEENLRACSRALMNAQLAVEDWTCVIARACAGDLVYFHLPQYMLDFFAQTRGEKRGATSLRSHLMHLGQVAGELKARGVRVIITATQTPSIERVLGPHFQVVRVETTRRNAWSREMEQVTRLIYT